MVINRRSLKIGLFTNDLRNGISIPKIVSTLILLYAYGFLIFYLLILNFLGPTDKSSSVNEMILVRPGMNAMEIGSLLENRGFIKNARLFRLFSEVSRNSRSLKAGAYFINANMSMFQILRKIASGDVILYKFTIPEGFTLSQVANLWESKGLGKAEKFIQVSQDKEFQEKYRINSNSLEGYLFPDTYLFTYGISEYEAIDKMLNSYNKKISYLRAGKSSPISLSDYDTITLASIIEREAKVGYEKPMISAVFHNRLKQNKKLESCATVLYSLKYPERELTYEDLRDTSSPYNTYVYKGLPPGPICNPGLESIIAALYPSNDRYLYFVSKNDGTHYFAETYNEFLIAKRKYQRG
jgi:UPF0755 protein